MTDDRPDKSRLHLSFLVMLGRALNRHRMMCRTTLQSISMLPSYRSSAPIGMLNQRLFSVALPQSSAVPNPPSNKKGKPAEQADQAKKVQATVLSIVQKHISNSNQDLDLNQDLELKFKVGLY